ncbi:hypothetical protein PAAG_11079 [Paracoccidioides lutzii Pb01]|uniref:SPX domain-containing protein n=1 Tax=Paracoccidioides lutzii (strain ATCC MYA-826 / Pb01) TaxID=502779 RepID=A0A0A2V3S5_PARBA|nr:hypothetical protein PAAG_11079 [Paracoccidioides lutzii Pb01]KGQ02128.1 hypothetical protein PAAG_11079 [Paracoccidioides lutzii Pb01]
MGIPGLSALFLSSQDYIQQRQNRRTSQNKAFILTDSVLSIRSSSNETKDHVFIFNRPSAHVALAHSLGPSSIELVEFNHPSSTQHTVVASAGLTSPPRNQHADGRGPAEKEETLGTDTAAPPIRWWEKVQGYFARFSGADLRRNPGRTSALSSLVLSGSFVHRWEAEEDAEGEGYFEEEGAPRDRNQNRKSNTKRRPRWETLPIDDDIMKFSHSIQFNAVPDWSSHYIAYSNLKKIDRIVSTIMDIRALIYSLEKQVNRVDEAGQNVESAPLLDSSLDTDTVFRRALDGELEKICTFYRQTETELYTEVENVIKDEQSFIEETKGSDMDSVEDTMVRTRKLSTGGWVRHESIFRSFGFGGGEGGGEGGGSGSGQRRDAHASTHSVSADGDDAPNNDDVSSDDDVDMDEPRSRDGRRRSSWKDYHKHYREPLHCTASDNSESRILPGGLDHDHDFLFDSNYSALYHTGITLKKRIISVYVSLCDLKSFIQLNRTGFSKALKKYDKTLDRSLRRSYMNTTVSTTYPFTNPIMETLNDNVAKIEKIYADLVTKGDLALSKRELRLHLREHVVWERNTVWREMIGIERKAQAANMGVRRMLLAGDQDPLTAQRQGDEQEPTTKEIVTPVGKCPVPAWLLSSTFFMLVAIVIVFGVMLALPIMKTPEQNNCLAMLVFVSLLWSTEVIPLFVTSLLVPFLVVILRIMRSEEEPYYRLNSKEATGVAFAAMWTPVIMLLLGGFTLAAALSKYDIARRMATFVLSKAGTKPRIVLLTNMFVGMILILWCVSHQLEATFGDMGVIAIIPLILFFGTGVLTKEDFNNFLWTIIILASGGLCLGRAVTSSGLLHTIAKAITERVADFSLYGVLITFTALILVVATFISHTVAALIMLPLVQQVGAGMDHPHPNLLIMGSALMCSFAMGLPTSGFPNMTAIMMEVPETGQRYLRVRHFITRGVPASVMSFGVLITLGYGLMIVAGL